MATLALCIPAYNASSHLPRLLQSANEQSIKFDEILVYNDCSSDNTKIIAENYGATVIEGTINVGCSKGKNILANIARSEWLHFHDADDDILPNFTKVAHRHINNTNSPDIILLHYHWINFDTQNLLGEPDYNNLELINDPIRFNIINKVVNFALVRKKAFLNIGGFDTDKAVLYNEDRAFYTKAAVAGLKFWYEPELTCINYFYPGSMSFANKAKCAKASLIVWQKVISGTNEKYSKEIAEQILNNATFAATANEWSTVFKSIKIAKEISPGIKPFGSNLFSKLFKLNSNGAYIIRELGLRFFSIHRKKNNKLFK